MSIKIFYFSGTGNTLALARDLASHLDNAELVRITYSMDFDQSDCEIAGIASPVYCFGQPNIVANFLEKVTFSPNTYIFGLSSYGGLLTSSGRRIKSALKKRGYTLQAGFAIQMPGNATYIYDVLPVEKRESMYRKEKERIPQIADIIKQKGTAGVDTNLGLLGRLASGATGLMMSKMNESGKNFFIDENCNGCETCAKVCPVGNIQMKDNKPSWQHTCEGCLTCFHWCPKASIQVNRKTSSRGRYHHPEVTLADVIK